MKRNYINIKENIDPEELKKRTEFLKTQRDKLLKMKQVERERILAQEESKHAKVFIKVKGSILTT